jgi:hypothetical protein
MNKPFVSTKLLIISLEKIMKKIFLLFSLSLLVLSFSLLYKNEKVKNDTQITDNQGIAIVELFTSEGCSSCPSADEVLSELADKPNVFPLGFHVTYWNRLGWKDDFSQKIFDERQYAYGEKFNLSSVYTPQVIVNGADEMVGSKRSKVLQSIDNQLKNTFQNQITLAKKIENNKISIQYQLNTVDKNWVLNVALTESKISTKVKHGENGGRTLRHDNVVRVFKTLPIQAKGIVDFDRPQSLDNVSVVAFLQEINVGKIVSAAKINL